MANGTSILEIKRRVIDAITHDDTIFYAFDAKECENGGDLKDTHIFNNNKIPETITNVSTYMTVMVQTRAIGRNKTFVIPTLEFYVYVHHEHMKMDYRITKDNRCDYISGLLEDMFNGSSQYGGIGELKCTLNKEGTYNQEFMYRHLVFETMDINVSACEGW